ncbi:MAG: hypothetical protein SGJ00_07070 [bacterium]|nr:hypothetical protein [bacterium]
MIENQISYIQGIKLAIRAGLISAGVNIAWLYVLEFALSISGLPKGFAVAVVLSSILPLILGAIVYVTLIKNFKKGEYVFIMLSFGFAIFSIFPSFQPILPDGNAAPANFALLTVPMHFVVAVIGV